MSWNCPACGEENKPKFRFCIGCGAPRGAAPAAPVEPAVPAAPVAAVPSDQVRAETAEPMPAESAASSRAAAETGWRCHECWQLNAEAAGRCTYCGTTRRSSERADRFDAVGGIFSRIGKLPLILVFLVAVAASLGWLYWYVNPKHGEEIPAPPGLEAAVRANLGSVSSRQVDSVRFFNCYRTTVGDKREYGGYAAFAAFTPRSANVANRAAGTPDNERFHHFIAHRDGYDWRLERFPAESAEPAGDPCVR